MDKEILGSVFINEFLLCGPLRLKDFNFVNEMSYPRKKRKIKR